MMSSTILFGSCVYSIISQPPVDILFLQCLCYYTTETYYVARQGPHVLTLPKSPRKPQQFHVIPRNILSSVLPPPPSRIAVSPSSAVVHTVLATNGKP